MSEDVELDTFGSLLENVESYSKIIEVATSIDEHLNLPDISTLSRETSELYNSYGTVIKELRKTKSEKCEFDASILVSTTNDEFSHDNQEYVDVCLLNNNYTETVVIQPEINFDDYCKYKTFGMDFVPWSQLLNKNIRVTQSALRHKQDGFSVEEFALGHIIWEITFYGFSSEKIGKLADEIKNVSKESVTNLKEMLASDEDFGVEFNSNE